MKYKKGYTLVELSVALAVGAIVLIVIFSLCSTIYKFTTGKEEYSKINNELESFKTAINLEVEKYEQSDYTFSVANSGLVLNMSNGVETHSMTLDDNSLKLDDSNLCDVKYITSLKFSEYGGLFKCEIKYNGDNTYTIILNKRI